MDDFWIAADYPARRHLGSSMATGVGHVAEPADRLTGAARQAFQQGLGRIVRAAVKIADIAAKAISTEGRYTHAVGVGQSADVSVQPLQRTRLRMQRPARAR
ncbi:hypothetical protein ATM17_40290 (plasmid) [Sphingopyxis macrogoltabida]|uniref:Uncharacterized protein n=1 Tax=Sphingopyxis macrogoltabida TaxID=33050 RepID=A0AAC9FHU6_SPHMC|nr:hypothetical protein LH19_28290 [Sphingopyxis macrogoltabida]AMU92921.1 hypothetical protein ATM17_40290 [Sphingopyxis macrogoltabida]